MARINGELANHSMEARIRRISSAQVEVDSTLGGLEQGGLEFHISLMMRQALDELAVRVEGAVSMSTDAVKRFHAYL
eukprot:3530153-Amphidinium_carterae.1